LSTLTKVLIVLLTVFSLFLSGIVVTYVANAENHRKTATETKRLLDAAKQTRDNAVRVSEEKKAEVEAVKTDLNAKMADRDTQITRLAGELNNEKRLNSELQQRLMSMDDRVATANGTAKQQASLHEAAQQKVEALEADRINREKELAETSQTLLEKMTIIAQLNDQVRQLTQENQDLGTRINQYLVQYGKIAAQPPTTVVQGTAAARPVPPMAAVVGSTKNIALNGQVTRVDARNRLVAISIGAAAGVRQNMTFHIIRGEQFVADIQIMEVQPDQSVGVLSVVKQGMQPQVGDKVATNL
jgi:myosin heavy subunit